MTLTILRLTLLLAVSQLAFALDYAVSWSVASTTATAITIQQPASSARIVTGNLISGSCASACTIVIERNGTAATATSATITKPTDQTRNAAFTAWTASDVGVGTVVERVRLDGGGYFSIPISHIKMLAQGTAFNFTVRITLDAAGSTYGTIRVKEDANN